jgi:hypothetical protein
MIKIFFATDFYGGKQVRFEIDGHSFILVNGKRCDELLPTPGFVFDKLNIRDFERQINCIKYKIEDENERRNPS